MKVQETAVILIEFQNDFCSPDGALYGLVEDFLTKQNTLENTKKLLEGIRGRALVIYVPITFTPDYRELKNPVGIIGNVVRAGAFRQGTKGAQFYAPLAPGENDIVIEGKRSLCGFSSTNLDFILRSRGIKNVAIAGFLTNICVESTARTAYDRGYGVIVLKDCTVATSMEEQKFAEEKIFPGIGEVMTYRDFLAKLENKTC